MCVCLNPKPIKASQEKGIWSHGCQDLPRCLKVDARSITPAGVAEGPPLWNNKVMTVYKCVRMHTCDKIIYFHANPNKVKMAIFDNPAFEKCTVTQIDTRLKISFSMNLDGRSPFHEWPDQHQQIQIFSLSSRRGKQCLPPIWMENAAVSGAENLDGPV